MLFPRGLQPNTLNRGGGGGGADIKWPNLPEID